MKKILTILCLFFISSFLRADLLDTVSAQLDLLEKEYWRSQYSAAGEYRANVEKRLNALASNVYRISGELRRRGLIRRFDIGTPTGYLQRNYGRIKVSTIKRFTLTFSGTGMREYTREYRNYLRDKEEQNPAKDDKASRTRRRSARKTSRSVPTLRNVDMIEYERWLAEVTAVNMEKFLRRKSNGSRSEQEKMGNAVSEYLNAIKDLRMVLVKIRQNTKIEFK